MQKTIIFLFLIFFSVSYTTLLAKDPIIKFGNAKLVVEDPLQVSDSSVEVASVEQSPSTVSVVDAIPSKIVIDNFSSTKESNAPILVAPCLKQASQVKEASSLSEVDSPFSAKSAQEVLKVVTEMNEVAIPVRKAEPVFGSPIHLPSMLVATSSVVSSANLGSRSGSTLEPLETQKSLGYYSDSESGALLNIAKAPLASKQVVGNVW